MTLYISNKDFINLKKKKCFRGEREQVAPIAPIALHLTRVEVKGFTTQAKYEDCK